jgi:hypothetical protein
MDSELERIKKDEIVAQLKCYPGIFREEGLKNTPKTSDRISCLPSKI